MTPTIERATAEAIIARAADGLKPFLALCRKMLATERPEVFAEATRAVNAGEAVLPQDEQTHHHFGHRKGIHYGSNGKSSSLRNSLCRLVAA